MADCALDRTIAELFIAWFRRAALKDGIDYWKEQFDAGASLNDISNRLWSTAVATAGTGYDRTMAHDDLIRKVIGNVWNYLPDGMPSREPIQHWTSWLHSNDDDYGGLVLEIIESIKKTDLNNWTDLTLPGQFATLRKAQIAFENKVQVSLIGSTHGWSVRNTSSQIEIATVEVIAHVTDAMGTVVAALKKMGITPNPSAIKVLVLGQSNAANFAAPDAHYTPHTFTTNFDKDALQERMYSDHTNPGSGNSRRFAGTPPMGGSVWGRVGDALITLGIAGHVLFDTRAVGSSSIADWATGSLNGEIGTAFAHNAFDCVVVQQGETDNLEGTSQADYEMRLQTVINTIRRYGSRVPILIAKTSRACAGETLQNSANVTNAQAARIAADPGCFFGADTDSIPDSSRNAIDANHFNAAGMRHLSRLWVDRLQTVLHTGVA
jgi:hypothetical protein